MAAQIIDQANENIAKHRLAIEEGLANLELFKKKITRFDQMTVSLKFQVDKAEAELQACTWSESTTVNEIKQAEKKVEEKLAPLDANVAELARTKEDMKVEEMCVEELKGLIEEEERTIEDAMALPHKSEMERRQHAAALKARAQEQELQMMAKKERKERKERKKREAEEKKKAQNAVFQKAKDSGRRAMGPNATQPMHRTRTRTQSMTPNAQIRRKNLSGESHERGKVPSYLSRVKQEAEADDAAEDGKGTKLGRAKELNRVRDRKKAVEQLEKERVEKERGEKEQKISRLVSKSNAEYRKRKEAKDKMKVEELDRSVERPEGES